MKTLIAYDANEKGFLGWAWKRGSRLYAARDSRFIVAPVRSWSRLIMTLKDLQGDIDSWQLWGHGYRGMPLIGESVLTYKRSETISLRGPWRYVWFRSCSVGAGAVGSAFLTYTSQKWKSPVYAHTHIIGNAGFQSGLVSSQERYPLKQGRTKEGVGRKRSGPFEPNTVTALTKHPVRGFK